MSKLKITLIQTDLYWEDVDANLAMLEEKIAQIANTDLIVLPEMFNTGFSMNVDKLAEPLNFKTFRWMNQMARLKNAAICGSYIVNEKTNFYNRLYFVKPSGTFDFYDKRHLFRMGDEHRTYTEGKRKMIGDYKGFKILPLICYDLRFPVWSKNRVVSSTGDLEYDVLIYVANWPAPRTDVWDALLKARALENQCFVLGVNRTGSDEMGIDYNGHSALYDYKGTLQNDLSNLPDIYSLEINLDDLTKFRKRFPAYLDWDKFDINVCDNV